MKSKQANPSSWHSDIYEYLSTGIALFQDGKPVCLNGAAKFLLKLDDEDGGSLGPYSNSLKELLELEEDHSKQLTGVAGQPLTAVMHILKDGSKLVELSESYETKLGEASHELRRPLTNIKTLVDTLYLWGAGDNPEARQKFLGQLHSEVGRMLGLLNDLLNLSRVQAGVIPVEVQRVGLRALVNETFDMLKEQADEKSIELKNDIPENYVLIADLEKISHVIQNLIENAIRYNREGGSVVIEPGDTENSFMVTDTGLGIPEESLTVVFERFKRLNKKIPGTGLGLAIVKSLVDLHGGVIDIRSKVDEGTSFIVKIPPKKLVMPPAYE